MALTREQLIHDVKDTLAQLHHHPHDLALWHQLAPLLDGRDINHEDCLVDSATLYALDNGKLLDEQQYIWETIRSRFPHDVRALARCAEFQMEVLDDAEAASPVVEALLLQQPEHIDGLRYRFMIAASAGDDKTAQGVLVQLVGLSPATIVKWGLLDHLDDIAFVRPHAPALLACIDEARDPSGYNGALREQLLELTGQAPPPPREVTPPAAEAWQHTRLLVDALELSVFTSQLLHRLGINTVGELVRQSDEDVRQHSSLRTVHELNGVLGELGLSLGCGRFAPAPSTPPDVAPTSTPTAFTIKRLHKANSKLGYLGSIARLSETTCIAVGGTWHKPTILVGGPQTPFVRHQPPNTPGLRGVWVEDNGTVTLVGEYGLHARSRNLDTWKSWTAFDTSDCMFGIAQNSDGTRYFVGDSGHVYLSDDRGATLHKAQLPRQPRVFKTCFVPEAGAAHPRPVFVAADGALYWWSNGKARRQALGTQPLTHLEVLPTGTLIVTGDGGQLFRSVDSGKNWQPVATDTEQPLEHAKACFGGVLVMGGHGTLLFSTDDGQTFSPVAIKTKGALWSACSFGAAGVVVGGDAGEVWLIKAKRAKAVKPATPKTIKKAATAATKTQKKTAT